MKTGKTLADNSSGNRSAESPSAQAQPRLALPSDGTGAIADDAREWMRLHDESPDGFAVFRAVRDRADRMLDLEFVHLNPAGQRMSGRSLADVRGRRLLEVFPTDRASGYFDRYARVAETGVAEVFELPFVGDRIRRWWRNVAVKFGDGVAVTFSDISERKRTEEALRDAMRENERTRARLETILKVAPVAIAFFDHEGRYRMVNEALTRLNGIAAEDHLGHTVAELLPQYAHLGDELMRRVIAGGQPVTDIEMTGEMPGIPGEIGTWVQHWWPVQDSSGETLGAGVIVQDVTDNRRDAAAVKEAEALYRSLTNAIPQIVFMNDADGLGLYVNEKWHEYTGLPRSERDAWLSALHPDEVESVIQRWRTGIAEGRPYETEYRFRRADGTYRWQLVRAVPVRDDVGVIRRWIGTMTDIDDLKRMQERLRDSERLLRESEERLNLAVSGAEMGLWDIDLKTGLDVWSESLYRIVGVSRAEASQPTMNLWCSLAHPADVAAVAEQADRARREHSLFSPELRIVRPDNGATIWVSAFGRFQYDDRGEAVRFVGMLRDITGRKLAEQRLMDTERRWRTLIDADVVGIVIADENRVIDANQRFLDMVGYGRDEIIGERRFIQLTPGEYAALDLRARQELTTTGAVTPFEKEFIRKDGTRVPVLLTGARLDQSPLSWIGFVMDLTERKRAEEQIRESERRWRMLVESQLFGVVIANEERVIEANQVYL
ncbi:MAG TPA: PAS domain S-box protein, partial [Candidatus Binataceae bacterium]|nr:PAS domain S-box protein [Candidatus Binataceae bacterium]